VVLSWEPLVESLDPAPPEVPPPDADSVVESEVEPDVVDDDPDEVDPEGAVSDEAGLSLDRRANSSAAWRRSWRAEGSIRIGSSFSMRASIDARMPWSTSPMSEGTPPAFSYRLWRNPPGDGTASWVVT